jgi:lipopolysaccharide/colanic/teichoic acid biosynthesis glycosyltransferase
MSSAAPSAPRAAQTCVNALAGAPLKSELFRGTAGELFMLSGTYLFAPGTAGRIPAIADAMRRLRGLEVTLCLRAMALPLMLVVAVLIKLGSRGPVLYLQDRVGRSGKVFTLLKFGSMRIDAEADGPSWAVHRDHRVMRVGRVIRASRIDELPQLINVLRGEMSVVKPRPERPYSTEKLTPVIPGCHERTHVLPGITGLAQVSYRYGA